ncbi:MAG: YihY/virulence factor BrkB family protein [Geminicoccaceae bacterium]
MATGAGWLWRLLRLLVNAVQHFLSVGGTVVAGHIAYTVVFALFPFLIFLVSLSSIIGQTEAAHEFIEFALESIPPEVATTITPAVEEVFDQPRSGLLTLSAFITLYVASSGFEAVRFALNLAYDTPRPRAFWHARLQSFFLTILFALLLVIEMTVLVAGPVTALVFDALMRIPLGWQVLFTVVRHAFAFFVLCVILLVMYRFLPNLRLGWGDTVPGAVFAAGLWLCAANIFTHYVQSFASYSVTYGPLAGIVLTLFFFYITASIVILGAELNAAMIRQGYRRRPAQRVIGKRLKSSVTNALSLAKNQMEDRGWLRQTG